jgi:hypothetical protein
MADSTHQMGPHAGQRKRDVRLDFFRGICLFIIFIAHVFANPWVNFIPARFGLSDAADIFVFCSGMASAVAFASVFVRRGFFLGTARIVFRIWQVYWAHISVFFVCAAVMLAFDRWLATGDDYIRGLMMDPLFDERAGPALLGLVTLTYVPPFFDILPMYLVILMMVPVVLGIERIAGPVAAMTAVVATWLVASFGVLDMPRAPWNNDTWYFNPFSWQLVFFTGFAFMRGWLPAPKPDVRLIAAAIVYLLVTMPLEWEPALNAVPFFRDAREALWPVIDKTHVGLLRYVHFLALAYLSFVAVGEGGRYLKGPIVRLVCKVGQQSLAIFLTGLVLSFSGSVLLNLLGRDYFTVPMVNLGGMGLLVITAYVVAWFKSVPWKAPSPAAAATRGLGRSRHGQPTRAQAIPAE